MQDDAVTWSIESDIVPSQLLTSDATETTNVDVAQSVGWLSSWHLQILFGCMWRWVRLCIDIYIYMYGGDRCRDSVRILPIGLSLALPFCYALSHAEVQAALWVISFSALPTCSVGSPWSMDWLYTNPWTTIVKCCGIPMLPWSMSMGLNLVFCYAA